MLLFFIYDCYVQFPVKMEFISIKYELNFERKKHVSDIGGWLQRLHDFE